MVRLRLATLALTAGLVLACGCMNLSECRLFGKKRCSGCPTCPDGGCCDGEGFSGFEEGFGGEIGPGLTSAGPEGPALLPPGPGGPMMLPHNSGGPVMLPHGPGSPAAAAPLTAESNVPFLAPPPRQVPYPQSQPMPYTP
jgi:hypothetical protein